MTPLGDFFIAKKRSRDVLAFEAPEALERVRIENPLVREFKDSHESLNRYH